MEAMEMEQVQEKAAHVKEVQKLQAQIQETAQAAAAMALESYQGQQEIAHVREVQRDSISRLITELDNATLGQRPYKS